MEKLPIWGELRHQVNNPLQIIVGCIDLLLEDHDDPRLRVAQSAVLRVATAVNEIAALLEDEGATTGGDAPAVH